VTVKRVADGRGSNWLCDQVEVGAELDTLPPAGTFTPRSLDADLLLVAAGSGITPVMSILRAALAAGRGPVDAALRQPGRAIGELRRRAARVGCRVPRAAGGAALAGVACRACPAGPRSPPLAAPHAEREVFLCGPTPFMDAMTHALRDLGRTAQAVAHRAVSSRSRRTRSPGCPPGRKAPPRALSRARRPPPGCGQLGYRWSWTGSGTRSRWPAGTLLLGPAARARPGRAVLVPGGGVQCVRLPDHLGRGEDAPQRGARPETDLDEGYVLACQALPITESVSVSYDE